MLPQALIALLLLTTSFATALTECLLPPPPASSLPTLHSCLSVFSALSDYSRQLGSVHLTWARHPPAQHGVLLPARFAHKDPRHDCEFLIDVVRPDASDVFPAYRIVEAAGNILHECLIGTGAEFSTVGREFVSPRRWVVVQLAKKGLRGNGSGILNLLEDGNNTEAFFDRDRQNQTSLYRIHGG